MMKIIVAGIIATSVMTLFMYLISLLCKKQFRVVHILGTMITNLTPVTRNVSHSRAAIVTGAVLHYLVGIGFAFCYYLIWVRDIVSATTRGALFMGFVNGVFAVIVWRLFIGIHPRPPKLPLNAYLLFILCGHLFFALTLWSCKILVDQLN